MAYSGWVRVHDLNCASYRPTKSVSRYFQSALLPLVYGAKGVEWFTYETYRTNHLDAECLFSAEASKLGGTPSTDIDVYNNITQVNKALRNMGPILMGLNWLRAFHSTSINNEPQYMWNADQTACPNTTYEDGLPTFSKISGSPLDAFIPVDQENVWVTGEFESHDGGRYFLVMNKDRDVAHQASLTFTPGYSYQLFDYHTGKWGARNFDKHGSSVTSTFTVLPTQLQIVRVTSDSKPSLNYPSNPKGRVILSL